MVLTETIGAAYDQAALKKSLASRPMLRMASLRPRMLRSKLPFRKVPANHGSSTLTAPKADGLVNTGARNADASCTIDAPSVGHPPTTMAGRAAPARSDRTGSNCVDPECCDSFIVCPGDWRSGQSAAEST